MKQVLTQKTENGATTVKVDIHWNHIRNERIKQTVCKCEITDMTTQKVRHLSTTSNLYFKDNYSKVKGREVTFKKLLNKLRVGPIVDKAGRREIARMFFSSSPRYENILNKFSPSRVDQTI